VSSSSVPHKTKAVEAIGIVVAEALDALCTTDWTRLHLALNGGKWKNTKRKRRLDRKWQKRINWKTRPVKHDHSAASPQNGFFAGVLLLPICIDNS